MHAIVAPAPTATRLRCPPRLAAVLRFAAWMVIGFAATGVIDTVLCAVL